MFDFDPALGIEDAAFQSCARTFAEDNDVPFERLDLDVFLQLASIRTIADAKRSPLFQDSAKEALSKSMRNAFDTKDVRTFSTQGITRPLVKPSTDELTDPSARFDTRYVLDRSANINTMGEHPFHAACVSDKFLQFWVAPDGGVRFLCDLYDLCMPDEAKSERDMLRRLFGTMQLEKEARARDRMRRKVEKRRMQQKMAAKSAAQAPAPPSRSDETYVPLPTEEEAAKMRARKQRAAEERAARAVASDREGQCYTPKGSSSRGRKKRAQHGRRSATSTIAESLAKESRIKEALTHTPSTWPLARSSEFESWKSAPSSSGSATRFNAETDIWQYKSEVSKTQIVL